MKNYNIESHKNGRNRVQKKTKQKWILDSTKLKEYFYLFYRRWVCVLKSNDDDDLTIYYIVEGWTGVLIKWTKTAQIT